MSWKCEPRSVFVRWLCRVGEAEHQARQPTGDLMDTKKTIGHDAAAQQVCAVIESLDREGSTPIYAGDAQADLRIVSITTGEGEAIRR